MGALSSGKKSKVAAVIAVVVIAALAGGLFLFMGPTEHNNDLTISESGQTVNGGTYDSVTVAASVGDGNVVLKNVRILGDLIVNGGGSHSIILESCTVDGLVEIQKESGEAPRILADKTSITEVKANSDAIVETKDTGSISKVTVDGSKLTVKGDETVIASIESTGSSSLIVADKATVDSINQSAGELVVEGTGTIHEVIAEDSKIDVRGSDTLIGKITVSGDTVLDVGDDSKVTSVTQKDGSVKIDGTGSIGVVEVNGAIDTDSKTVSNITVNKVSSQDSVSIRGDSTVDIVVNTDSKLNIKSESEMIEVGTAEGITAEILINDSEAHIHNLVMVVDRESTCEIEGSYHHQCTDGDGYTTNPLPLPLKEHTAVIDQAVNATCSSTGLTEGSHCSVCNKVLKQQEVIGKLPHTPSQEIRENVRDSTMFSEGSYDSVIICNLCKEEISRSTLKIPMKGIVEGKNTNRLCREITVYLVGETCVSRQVVTKDTYGRHLETETESLVSIKMGDKTYSGEELLEFLEDFVLTMEAVNGMECRYEKNGSMVDERYTYKNDGKVYTDSGYRSESYFIEKWHGDVVKYKRGGDYYGQSEEEVALAYDGHYSESPGGYKATRIDAEYAWGCFIVYYMDGEEIVGWSSQRTSGSKIYVDKDMPPWNYKAVSATMGGVSLTFGKEYDIVQDMIVNVNARVYGTISVYCDDQLKDMYSYEAGTRFIFGNDWYSGNDRYVVVNTIPEIPLGSYFEADGTDIRINVAKVEQHTVTYVCGDMMLIEYTYGSNIDRIRIPGEFALNGEFYRPVSNTGGFEADTEFMMPDVDLTVYFERLEKSTISYVYESEVIRTDTYSVGTTVKVDKVFENSFWTYSVKSISGGYEVGMPFTLPSGGVTVTVGERETVDIIFVCDGAEVYRYSVYDDTYVAIEPFTDAVIGNPCKIIAISNGCSPLQMFLTEGEDITVTVERYEYEGSNINVLGHAAKYLRNREVMPGISVEKQTEGGTVNYKVLSTDENGRVRISVTKAGVENTAEYSLSQARSLIFGTSYARIVLGDTLERTVENIRCFDDLCELVTLNGYKANSDGTYSVYRDYRVISFGDAGMIISGGFEKVADEDTALELLSGERAISVSESSNWYSFDYSYS